jgi:SGNH domain (fused to AT3 domains)
MRTERRGARRSALVAALVAGALSVTASAAAMTSRATPPSPGTSSQIAALVRAASSITKVPTASWPSLTAEGADSASHEYPATSHGCFVVTACVFGDTNAKRTIVLFGDSHAQMWLSAVDPAAIALKYRVVLLFLGGCPAATLTVWNPEPLPPFPAGYYTGCNTFRSKAIKAINRLHPVLVLLSNRTAMVESGNGTFFTNAQWEKGVRATILALKKPGTKIAVIGDIDYFNLPMPDCLAANPSSVQSCASPNPNSTSHGHASAEKLEAIALDERFIETLPWACTKTCSPVIGSFLPYLNSTHLDATYVTYLTKVMQSALVKVLG